MVLLLKFQMTKSVGDHYGKHRDCCGDECAEWKSVPETFCKNVFLSHKLVHLPASLLQ